MKRNGEHPAKDEDIVWSLWKHKVVFEMNYKNLYHKFVEKFKAQVIPENVYTERHHIVPRHIGGTDDESNLVTVTYRQHTFLHRLLWKAEGRPQDLTAYRLMASIRTDSKFELCSMAGKIGGARNKESGHIAALGKIHGKIIGQRHKESGFLESIRLLANTPVRQEKLVLLNQQKRETGSWRACLEKAWEANRGAKRSEEICEKYRQITLKRMSENPEQFLGNLKDMNVKANLVKKKNSEDHWIAARDMVTVRNSEFLTMTSDRSTFIYVSPEGLSFDSYYFAAHYYGLSPSIVHGWSRNKAHGWARISKTDEE